MDEVQGAFIKPKFFVRSFSSNPNQELSFLTFEISSPAVGVTRLVGPTVVTKMTISVLKVQC